MLIFTGQHCPSPPLALIYVTLQSIDTHTAILADSKMYFNHICRKFTFQRKSSINPGKSLGPFFQVKNFLVQEFFYRITYITPKPPYGAFIYITLRVASKYHYGWINKRCTFLSRLHPL